MSCDVAILVYDLRASGVVRNALRIAGAARDEGLSVELWPVRPQGEFLARVPGGVAVRPIRARASGRQRDLDSLLSVGAIAARLRAEPPRVLLSVGNQMHLHAALAFVRGGDPLRTHFVGRASNAVVSARRVPLRGLLCRLERFQYLPMHRIVAVCEELRTQIVEVLGIAPQRISTIANGIDVDAVRRAADVPLAHPAYCPPGPPVIVGVGRISRQKDFATLVRAFAQLRRVREARLVIVGRSSRRQRARLRRLAARLRVGGDVWIEGHAANPFPFVRHAALFVSSSRWEGASNAVLEALACGTPVVATRAPTGIAEVLEPDGLAPLVPVGDARALAAAMLARLASPRGEERLVARARDFALGATTRGYAQLLAGEAVAAPAGTALD